MGVRSVTIHTNHNGEDITMMSTIGGAAIGSQFGKGDGQVAATVLGGVAGAMAGEHINKKMSEHPGFEYQVELENGTLVTITQGTEPNLYLNQKVLIIQSNRGRSRIVPDTTFSN